MSTPLELFEELQADVATLIEPLFEFSEQCLRKRGGFLPHAAILTEEGAVELTGAAPDGGGGLATSAEVLPLLQGGLRAMAKIKQLTAVAVAENVTVTPNGEPSTAAVKVLFEHKRGLTVALYLPFRKRFLRGYVFGETFMVPAPPEVDAWGAD
jgi:hypothetical protein